MAADGIEGLEIGVRIRKRNAGFRLSDVQAPPALASDNYEKRLKELQYRLLAVELAYRRLGKRALIVFEGRDAAGKGGTIRRLTAEMDPRGHKVWPIGPPTLQEQGRHYLYRFFTLLPSPGQIAIFDRSWYGRVLVERVDELISADAWRRAYKEINGFERTLVDDGARIVKIFMHVSRDEQLRRFEERMRKPHKRWKITPDDIRNRLKWDAYETAIDDMIARTSTKRAPWIVIPSDDKRYARIEALQVIAGALSEGVDTGPPPLDPEIVRLAEAELGLKLKE